MTQRNFMNERYQEENRGGKTRKSASSAKPKAARAATVRDPAPKTKKQKKEEARERERKEAQKANAMQGRFEETPGYKRLRRIWWVLLVSAILCTVLSFVFQRDEGLKGLSMGVMIAAYALIIGAFYIDLGKIRKERKLFNAALVNNKSKEARREQKRMKAELREQEKEAAEKFEAAQAEEEAKREQGFLARLRKKKDDSASSGSGASADAESGMDAGAESDSSANAG